MQNRNEDVAVSAANQLKKTTSALFNRVLDALEGRKSAEDEKEKENLKNALNDWTPSKWEG